ncbi:hypothetical protein NW762_013190 [Fusarium torreyae]|uniref:NmrA-like domain-containing protein n=1 Tax=Fusarium torreyae TaxID=1237075 RepID=A0A9W8V832_9HYPO|nr:hypothetical protein NW762_013190 [Fusarium torreyae]
MQTILVIGSTGAQGSAIIRYLSSTERYHILAFTRSAASSEATSLAELPHVELVVSGSGSGYDTGAFLSAASRADSVLVNTDGFALGEQAETYWGIRLFELSAWAGVKHFVYSGLDSNGPRSGFDPDLYCGHYQGKAKVQDWIHAQKDISMNWTIIRSGPYLQLLAAVMAPAHKDDGSLEFQLPLGNGAIPFIHLGDFGKYVDWALSNPNESKNLDFGIATAHVTGSQIAAACQNVTDKPSKFVDIPIETWNAVAWKALPEGPNTKVGFQNVKDPSALLMSYGENFTHWWNLYKASANNSGLIQRDYEFLDKIVPDRIKGIEAWMRETHYTGDKQEVLKLQAATG